MYVYDNNVCEAQMCTSFYYLIVSFLLSVQDYGAVEELQRINYLIQEGF